MSSDNDLPIDAWHADLLTGWARRMRPDIDAEVGELIKQLQAMRRGEMALPKQWPSVYYLLHSSMNLTHKRRVDLAQLQPWLWDQRGPNVGHLRMALLELLGAQADPTLLDLWREALAYVRPRDKEGPQRRRVALSALGLLLLKHDDSGAEALLVDALNHSNAKTVGDAARVLMGLHTLSDRPARKTIVDALQASLLKVKKQPAQLRVRRALERMGVVPNNVGSWIVRVWLQEHAEVTRTLEVGAGRTLAALHYGIQTAFDWDADHPYSFFPSGTKVDPSLEVSAMGHGQFHGEDDVWDADLLARDVLLGDVVMRRRQRFLYLFDYGDRRMFVVEVVDAGEGDASLAPTLVAAEGEAPAQYGWFG